MLRERKMQNGILVGKNEEERLHVEEKSVYCPE